MQCSHGENGDPTKKCRRCGIFCLLILSALSQPKVYQEVVEVMVWGDSIRQGDKKGKQNTQKELVEKDMTVKQLVAMFFKQAEECIPHYQEICWMRHMKSTDFSQLKNDTLLIFTHFAAVMALRAFQTPNSCVDAHAINDSFVVIYNRETVQVGELRKDIETFDVDVHHFFAETISKGKKNDHAMPTPIARCCD